MSLLDLGVYGGVRRGVDEERAARRGALGLLEME